MKPQNDNSSLGTYRREIASALEKGRIGRALTALDNMAAAISAAPDMRDEAMRLRQDYTLLKRYALDGVADPQRQQVRSAICTGIISLADRLVRQSDSASSPRLYFSTLRYEGLQRDSSIPALADTYISLSSKIGLAMLGGVKAGKLHEERHSLAARLFRLVWVSHPLNSEQAASISRLIADEGVDSDVKSLLVSALMLGALEYYDERRLMILGETYLNNPDANWGITALCAMLLVMWIHRRRIYTSRFRALVSALSEKPQWKSDVKMVFLQFLRARDTERITRKVNDELIPGMMKMKPDIERKMQELSAEPMADPESMEMNPEWEDMLEKSGLADKMRELSEIQAEGGDVMMSTFSRLKGFPFFNDIVNWFRPFSEDLPEVVSSGVAELMLSAIGGSGALCDSDKYSMVFSMTQVPEPQRRMMLDQFKAYGVSEAEIRSASLDSLRLSREAVAINYVRNLYRFFKLFRRKGEFRDPFSSPVNLPSIDLLAGAVGDIDTLQLVAEFYFTRGYYADALGLYNLLMDQGVNDWRIYQKAGYSLQMLGRIGEALEMYERSELINSGSLWTLRRMAQCLRQLNRPKEALECYRRIEQKRPDDLGVSMAIGHSLLEMGRPAEALKAYFKVEFMQPDSRKAWRPIAWCSLLTGDLERARDYYNRLLAADPTSEDYLNAGHMAMLENRFHDAVKLYRKSRTISGTAPGDFERSVISDLAMFGERQPERLMIDLVIEELDE